ncbi:MAG: nucleotidyl transferase AbiEii/AbiGii toxin family protein [Lentisphaerae bacterium]|nr:nucleotidyl transferase AbiEii/AbiGii toxin family protein [Lentisphaerota bacterium]
METFKRHFAGFEDSFVLIGGAACDQWFTRFGGRFRATKDIDMVLVLKAVQTHFFPRFWTFIKNGGYEIGQRAGGQRTYFRFIKPSTAHYPKMIELFSIAPVEIGLLPGQYVVPIPVEETLSSLSAILMDPDYYGFIMGQRDLVDGLPLIKPAGLIALKVRAWLDLALRRSQGDTKVKKDDVNKHRSDVFRLASILPTGEQLDLPLKVARDLGAFLAALSTESPEWPAVRQSLDNSGIRMTLSDLLGIMKAYFQVKD